MGKDNRNYVSTGYMQNSRQNNGCCENWNAANDVVAETNSNGCGCNNDYVTTASNGCCDNDYSATGRSNSCCDNGYTTASDNYSTGNYNTGKGKRKNKCNDCDEGTHVFFETCDGQQEICVTGTCEDQQSLGRILDVTTTLQNVCPGRRSAVGLTLTEVDNDGTEYARGFRAITVPAHNGNCNRDVQLDSVRFILPDDLSLQRRRHFICRVSHHYMDADNIWG